MMKNFLEKLENKKNLSFDESKAAFEILMNGTASNDEIFNYQNVALSRKINTPSYNQVIEKLYTRALGRWKNYKTEMKDVLPILEFWTKKWQY